jgi:tetratricopeptide (TPR) repeat protein
MHRLVSTLLAAALVTSLCAQNQDTSSLREAADSAVASADWKTAIANYKKLVDANAKDGRSWHMLGYSLHASGDLEEALKIHLKAAEFPDFAPIASYNAACVYALRGDKDAALKWLETAAQKGFDRASHIAEDTDMDALRDEPRFKEIVAKIEKNSTQSPRVQTFAGSFDRKLARMVLFAGQGSIGGVSISYGQVDWKDKYDEMIASPKYQGHRWRLGKDEWTTLDTSVPLTIGDAEISPGIYYLTLAHKDGKFVLAAIDPASVHAHTIDPYLAHKTTGGTEVVLAHEETDAVAEQLTIKLASAMGAVGKGELVVRFGKHKLSAPIALHTKASKQTK